ncbi:uncharacterized protein [Lolium perenne]|uniref:uncharacterized protein n=1 Tax=Lolium perenne TaxID=4522 RepID=UPI0021F62030|nr:uncharacterized protein LOC127330206 [Lolium perenne]
MGSVVGTAANGVGTLIGNAFTAPLRAVFSASCEGVCSGTWDVACFLEHLCVASLGRLFMVLVLVYIMLFFVYLMCKVGIIQCVAKNSCKMAAAACSSCCHALTDTSCFLWRKLRDTKRVYRGRRRRRPPDIERGSAGSSTDEEEDSYDSDHDRTGRGASRWRVGSSSVRERRKDRLRQSLRLRRLTSKKEQYAKVRSHGSGRHHQHGRVGLDRTEVPSTSLRVHGSPKRRARA